MALAQAMLAAAIVILLAACGCHAQAVEKGRVVNCTQFTRARDCAPWGLNTNNGQEINPAFRYDYDDPLAECDGVINRFYFFKLLNFGAELETSVAMRALKGFSEAMWNAWAHYHPTATDTLGKLTANPGRRQPAASRTIVNKNIALAYALTRATAYLIPSAKEEALAVLESLVNSRGLTGLETAANTLHPQGIGNLVAQELIASLKVDGWNSEGNMSPRMAFPFADYTAYEPVNTEYTIRNPLRWQPLIETDANGYFFKQLHTTPHLRSPNVKPWSTTRAWIEAKQVSPPWGTSLTGQNLVWYKGNATRVLQASAGLTPSQKLIAEFFDAKILSFGGFERWYAHKNGWCHDQWIVYDQLSACLHDATVLAWKEKIRIDAIRPMSAIRHLRNKASLPAKVQAWGGAAAGYRTVAVDPYKWQSYLRTMPHSEFPSGTSCICQVWAEWTRKFQKDDIINLPLQWDQGCSSVEKGVTPGPGGLAHQFGTIGDALKVCTQSRSWAGVHFEASLAGGTALCSGVADQCYAKVQRLLKGNPNN